MSAYIADTETTGTEPEDQIIELAHTKLVSGPWSLSAQSFDCYYKPTKPIVWGAMAAHHIIPSDLEHMQPSSVAAMPADCTILIGHNIDFDWKMLGKPDVKRICTLAMARAVWPYCDSHKLSALYYYICGANEESRQALKNAHNAAADVQLCWRVLQEIISTQKISNLSDLYEFSEECRIPKIMTFGKFKDQPVSNVDRGYVQWYRRQPDPDPYLLMAFSRYCR